jgi:general secretion pathway protein J
MTSAAQFHRASRAPLYSDGFTLVELLVGLTLFALMSVLMFGGLRLGLRAWESGGERIDEAAQVELVQSLLRGRLSQARLPRFMGPQDEDRNTLSAFNGTVDAMSFVAPLPIHSGNGGFGGFAVFLLTERQAGERASMELAWKIFRPDVFDRADFEPDEERVLLDDIAGTELAYYGQFDASRPPAWLDQWDGALGLPQLIRVRVSFPPGDRRRWPDLVVAPRLYERYL